MLKNLENLKVNRFRNKDYFCISLNNKRKLKFIIDIEDFLLFVFTSPTMFAF